MKLKDYHSILVTFERLQGGRCKYLDYMYLWLSIAHAYKDLFLKFRYSEKATKICFDITKYVHDFKKA